MEESTGWMEVSLPNWQTTDITQKSYVIRKWKIWPLPAETVACPENPGSFITAVLTQPATGSDEVGLTKTLQKLEVLGLERPRELYADRAYISGQAIEQAKEEGWELISLAQPSAARAGLEKPYRIEAFNISIKERKARCPQGKMSSTCSKLTEAQSGKISFRFEFGRQCQSGPQKAACVPKAQTHRTITVGVHHENLQQRRRDQQSEAFALRMQLRNAIKGTTSELVRGCGCERDFTGGPSDAQALWPFCQQTGHSERGNGGLPHRIGDGLQREGKGISEEALA